MIDKEKVYVTGHKNPDSDSICAAIGYANLKNQRGKIEAIPIRLGEINRETRFILDYFGVKAPKLMETMKPTIMDIAIDPPYKICPLTTMSKALNILQTENISSLQVIDESNKLLGIVTLSNLTEGYMEIWDNTILSRSNTPLENILEVIKAEVVLSSDVKRPLGRMTVYAMEPEDVEGHISENDIVIMGNRDLAQKDAIKRKVSLIILTLGSNMSKENLELAKKNGVTVISTQLDSFLTARLLPLSVPVNYVMTKDNLVKFHADEFVDDISVIMGKTRFRSYPVVDSANEVVGSISRFHLISNKKRPLILVDHNEKNQSIPDLDSAEIVEIIDHHRVANVATTSPILFRNMPLGSTSTIVSLMYFEQGVSPSREIAGILAAAIMSDTLLLTSPTTREEDKRMLERMSKIAGINPEDFASEMFKAGTSLEGKSSRDLLTEDMKEFNIEGEKVRVAQVFTMDMESLSPLKNELVDDMQAEIKNYGLSTFVLVVTDIREELSQIIVIGEYQSQIAQGFNQKISDNSFIGKGVLSRKKQVIPEITKAISEAKNS